MHTQNCCCTAKVDMVVESKCALDPGALCAGRVKTEIVHFLANDFTLDKFRSQKQVLGSELVLTDFDEADMSVQSVLDFMAAARENSKEPASLSLRAREGTTLNLLRMYGKAQAPQTLQLPWLKGELMHGCCQTSCLGLGACGGPAAQPHCCARLMLFPL